ncbi:hypothetical protein ACH4PU_30500 [Streptomyces sp. NPDC021100]|uniref:hypothetical protein n=1 Tax=Streptomyces sp. NPDC021100 TaxID=3365114 RepID=UPI0037BABB04
MPTTTSARLDRDEERVTSAQRLLVALGAALVATPFDRGVHDQLRRFLANDAEGVLASLRVLEQRPEEDLRTRIAELAGHSLRPAPLGGAS